MKKPQGKRALRQRRQGAEPAQPPWGLRPFEVRPIELDEMSELARFALQPSPVDGDSCRDIPDYDIGVALLEQPILLSAAKRLSEMYGRVIARSDLEARIVGSERLRGVHSIAQQLHDQLRMARVHEVIAAHGEAEHARELAREARHRRNHGPRCGAKTRTGQPCKRKVVLGRTRCPNHGGLSTGPTTAAGKAQSAENGRKRWAGRRAQK